MLQICFLSMFVIHCIYRDCCRYKACQETSRLTFPEPRDNCCCLFIDLWSSYSLTDIAGHRGHGLWMMTDSVWCFCFIDSFLPWKELKGFVPDSFLFTIYVVNLCHTVSVLIFDNTQISYSVLLMMVMGFFNALSIFYCPVFLVQTCLHCGGNLIFDVQLIMKDI